MAKRRGRWPQVSFTDERLDNGLRLIMAPDALAPVAAVNLWYNVGSRNERAGQTGIAHLFEHMMFQGSKHVKGDSHFRLLEGAGSATDRRREAFMASMIRQTLDEQNGPVLVVTGGYHSVALHGRLTGQAPPDTRARPGTIGRRSPAIPSRIARMLLLLPDPKGAHQPGGMDAAEATYVSLAAMAKRPQPFQGTAAPWCAEVPRGGCRRLADRVAARLGHTLNIVLRPDVA